MKILSAAQIKTVDQLTTERQHISSADLMERVAVLCTEEIEKRISEQAEIVIFCGKGNNGGDGLAIARLLAERDYTVTVVIVHHSEDFSGDAQINFERLNQQNKAGLTEIFGEDDFQKISVKEKTIVIDALLGTGLNKPLEGLLETAAEFINKNSHFTISIDVPSGLFADEFTPDENTCVHANLVLTLQIPKLAYLFSDNSQNVPAFKIIDIGLDQQAISEQVSSHYFSEIEDITTLLLPRSKFSHKGTYGHGLLIAGSKDTRGAAIIAAEACLRSGAGLLTVHSTKNVTDALAIRLPEAMSNTDQNEAFISDKTSLDKYRALGFGPGTGTAEETADVLKYIIQNYQGKLIIDADGLNILSENKTWLEFLPKETILTPHPKEFERLAGTFENDFDRLQKAKLFAIRHQVILVLKDAYTAICLPDGSVVFNSTGNPGLAKGGSGDALTGIILGLLTRGYSPAKAAISGVFIHGYAADLCSREMSMESMLITDVIKLLPKTFRDIELKRAELG